MYTSSEEAMDANEAISFARAGAELQRHQTRWGRPIDHDDPATRAKNDTHIMVWAEETGAEGADTSHWECIPRTSKAILEWLGY